MRRAPHWLRSPVQGTRQILALVMSALLLWCAVSRAATVTARGVQCPTAVVQTAVFAKRNCCGKVVGYEVRKPKEGERGFLQCRCAERKSAQHGAAEAPAPRVEALVAFEAPLALALPSRPPEALAGDTYLARLTVVPAPPFVRPPQVA